MKEPLSDENPELDAQRPMTKHEQTVKALQEHDRPHLLEVMVFIAGLALAFKLFGNLMSDSDPFTRILAVSIIFLGGLSVFGPILLIIERIKRKNQGLPWQPGRILWFSTGISAWITWPPIIASSWSSKGSNAVNDNTLSICMYIYGTPLMAIYMVITLLAGGWIGHSKPKSKPRSWKEVFGLLLGLAWACTGMWVVYLMYFSKVKLSGN